MEDINVDIDGEGKGYTTITVLRYFRQKMPAEMKLDRKTTERRTLQK